MRHSSLLMYSSSSSTSLILLCGSQYRNFFPTKVPAILFTSHQYYPSISPSDLHGGGRGGKETHLSLSCTPSLNFFFLEDTYWGQPHRGEKVHALPLTQVYLPPNPPSIRASFPPELPGVGTKFKNKKDKI